MYTYIYAEAFFFGGGGGGGGGGGRLYIYLPPQRRVCHNATAQTRNELLRGKAWRASFELMEQLQM